MKQSPASSELDHHCLRLKTTPRFRIQNRALTQGTIYASSLHAIATRSPIPTKAPWNMPAPAFIVKSYLYNTSTYNCTFNATNDDNWAASNPNAAACSDWNSAAWVLVVTLVPMFVIPFVALVVAVMIHGMHRRKSRRDAESVREDESREEDEPKLKQITFGSSSELSESATKVQEDIKEKDEEADKEDDISSHTPSSLLFYQHSQERSVMQFFKMGIFRATPSAESQVPGRMSSGVREFSEPPMPSLASGAHGFRDSHSGSVPDYDDPYNHIADDGTCTFRPPAPAFHACSSRPRSFSESTIIAPTKSSTHSPILTPSSLPSSPPINAGTEYQNCHSTFSLSLSDRLERLNKQIQKKTSTSSLKAASGVSLNEAGVGAFEMGREGGGGSKRGGIGHIRSESSMDFKCCGLPESGTFSKLSDAEATMRAADELATKQRLSGSIY